MNAYDNPASSPVERHAARLTARNEPGCPAYDPTLPRRDVLRRLDRAALDPCSTPEWPLALSERIVRFISRGAGYGALTAAVVLIARWIV
jgi:hypothetical protein